MRPASHVRLRQWRKRRAKKGRRDPLPLNVMVGNCMSVSASPADAIAIFESYLDTNAVVLLLSECSDFDGQRVADAHAGRGVWKVVQFGAVGSDTSGSLIAVRTKRGTVIKQRTILGSKATSEGGGFRDRWMVQALIIIDGGTRHVWRHWFTSGHAPAERAPRARRIFMRAFARVLRGSKGGDMNLVAKAIARLLGRAVHTIGVLSLAVAAWVPSSDPRTIPKRTLGNPDHHADHDGLAVALFPSKEKP